RLEVSRQGDNPVDLSVSNNGEADVPVNCTVTVTWKEGILIASDALPGWDMRVEPGRASFRSNSNLRLPPGFIAHSNTWITAVETSISLRSSTGSSKLRGSLQNFIRLKS